MEDLRNEKPSDLRNRTQSLRPLNGVQRESPPICRIYGFANEMAQFMESLMQVRYDSGEIEYILPSSSHYTPRTEVDLGMTAKPSMMHCRYNHWANLFRNPFIQEK